MRLIYDVNHQPIVGLYKNVIVEDSNEQFYLYDSGGMWIRAQKNGPKGDTGDIALFIGDDEPPTDDVLWVDTNDTAHMTIPAGGTTGQALLKASGNDYELIWGTIAASSVGLGNVNNTSDANKPVSTAQAAAIALKADKTYVDTQDALKANQATTYTKTEVDTKDSAVASTAATNLGTHTARVDNPHSVTKSQVGLGNVDNTSDANKPISTAETAALALKANISSLAPVATSGDHGALIGLADDDHPQYHNDGRADSRYAGAQYSSMSKSVFGSLLTSYGLFGQTLLNSGSQNDLIVYGQSIQPTVPTPDIPVSITSTTGDVTIRSDTKNRAVANRPTTTASGVTFTNNGDGTYTLNGTATADIIFYPDLINNINNIYVPAGLITLSGVTGGSSTTYLIQLALTLADNSSQFRSTTTAPSTFTQTQSGMGRIYINVKNGTTVTNVVIAPQLEFAGAFSSFEKNTSSVQTLSLGATQLRSLPNGVSDRIYKSAGNWWLEQNVGTTILNGSTVFAAPSNRTNTTLFTVIDTSVALYTPGELTVSSSHFPAQDTTLIDTDVVGISSRRFANQGLSISVPNAIATTNAAFTTWLTTNNVNVQYKLATPVVTQITNSAQIAALENVRTYRGITNITATTPISGSYNADLTALLSGKEPTITVLPVTKGGTGLNALTSGNFLVASSTTAIATTKVAPAGVVVGTTDAQTLTNKTLTDPLINGFAPEMILSRTTGINAFTTGNTTLFTVPTGKTAIITRAIVRVSAATAVTNGPTASVGGTATADVFASTALTALNATTKMFTFSQVGMSTLVPASTTVKLNISVAATGTSETLAVDLIGYLI